MTEQVAQGWEPVLTVHEFYDGPRSGIAEYRGQAHAYKCECDDALYAWDSVFILSPIDDDQLAAVKEDWLIWRRFRKQQAADKLQRGDKHPTLAADWPRHDELARVVEQDLRVNEGIAIKAVPEFRGTIEPEHDFEARWRPV